MLIGSGGALRCEIYLDENSMELAVCCLSGCRRLSHFDHYLPTDDCCTLRRLHFQPLV